MISKPVNEFTPDEYYAHVVAMWARQTKGSKPASPAPGLSVSVTKAGKLSIRRSKVRAFDYVTMREIELLAKHIKLPQSDVWNAFRARDFIIAKDRMSAENILADTRKVDITLGGASGNKNRKTKPKVRKQKIEAEQSCAEGSQSSAIEKGNQAERLDPQQRLDEVLVR